MTGARPVAAGPRWPGAPRPEDRPPAALARGGHRAARDRPGARRRRPRPRAAGAGPAQRLDGSLDTADLDRSARSAGLLPDRVRQLLGLLLRAGVLDDLGARAAPLAGWRGDVRARLAPDLASLALLHPTRTDGAAGLLEARSRRWVEVHGGGRLGAGVARLLAASGVGGSRSRTPRGPGPPMWRRSRCRAPLSASPAGGPPRSPRPATRHWVRQVPPRPRRTWSCSRAPAGAGSSAAVDGLLRQRDAHLLAGVRETAAVVGPLVVPGVTSCLHCVDLHRRDRDPGWPVIAAQLMAGGPDVEPCDTVLAALGSAAAAAQVLSHLDGARDGPARDGALEYALPHGLLRRRSWSAHPLCGCRWVQ